MTQASTVHTSVEENRKRGSTTASNIRGYMPTPSMLQPCSSRHSSREKSAHRKVGIRTSRNARGNKNNQSRPLLSPKTKHPRPSILRQPKNQIPIPEGNSQIQRVRKFAGARVPARSLVCHQSFNAWRQAPMWIQTHLEASCAAAQRLSAHAADTATGLAHACLALSTASAGRGSLANAESANTATTTGTATRCLGCACRRSHALLHRQLQLVD
jgi:hypothetical protein